MTRCSDPATLIILAMLASPACADPLVSDAFGLFDPATSQSDRALWAGRTGDVTTVSPNEADRLVIFAGPKSLVAGKDPGHVVAIAIDRHGNLVADGSPAQVSVAGVATPTITLGGIADLLVPPQEQSGDLFVGVTVGARQSPKAMLSITADLASIRPELLALTSQIDFDTEFELQSEPLVDRFGNIAPDGTGVTTLLRHADGSYSLAQGVTLRGSAAARFIARDIPGPATAKITLGQQTTIGPDLTVLAPVAAGLPSLELIPAPEIEATRLRLGPFLTTTGYSLSDGAQVDVTTLLPTGEIQRETAWVMDGEVNLLLPLAPGEEIRTFTVSSPLGPMDLTTAWLATSEALAKSGETP